MTMYQPELTGVILDNLSEIVYVSDHDNNLLYVNRTAELVTGRSTTGMIGKKCYEIFRDPSGACLANCPVKKLNPNENRALAFERSILNSTVNCTKCRFRLPRSRKTAGTRAP